MRGDVEVCHQHDEWRIGIVGDSVFADGYRTLDEAMEVAWVMAAQRKVALHVGKNRNDGVVPA